MSFYILDLIVTIFVLCSSLIISLQILKMPIEIKKDGEKVALNTFSLTATFSAILLALLIYSFFKYREIFRFLIDF